MILQRIVPPLTRFVAGVSVVQTAEVVTDRPVIYVANHTSHLDFAVLWSALPRRMRDVTRPVAARDYWSSGIRHYMACNVFSAILIDRRSSEPGVSLGELAITAMSQAIAEGSSVILFPEGTRGDGSTIAPFKSGLYHLCRQHPDMPVVPVYLQNLSRMLPKGHTLPIPLLSTAVFGAPTTLQEGETKEDFLVRIRACVEELGRR